MATLVKNASLDYESAQQFAPLEAMTNPSGDYTIFVSTFSPWSGVENFEPSILPYGLDTGGVISPTTNNNEVTITAGTAFMAGSASADTTGMVSFTSNTLTVTRPATTSFSIIGSVTIDNSATLVMVMGTEGAAISETRGAAGGPPFIPVDSVEIGQVRLTDDVAAVISEAEILQVLGLSQERWDYPGWTEMPFDGQIEFYSALPLIHTGDAPKLVYVQGYTPIFAPIPEASEYVPAEQTQTVNTTTTYDGARGSASSTINQASFNALLKDGITDPLLKFVGDNLYFRFKPNKLRAPYQLTQGLLAVARSFPAEDNISAAFTVTATEPSRDFAS